MVRIVTVDPQQPDAGLLREAADLILKGAVVVCPTDTGYAFGANALDEKAIERVFSLKGRSFSNPIHVTVGSVEEAARYAYIDPVAERLMRHFLPGALTVVLRRKEIIPARLVGSRDTVGIRIPDNKVILGLASIANVPITSTSANISGRGTPYDVVEILEQLGQAVEQLAIVLDQGRLPVHGLSTIIDMTSYPPKLIRPGLIAMETVLNALDLRPRRGESR